MQHGTLVLIKQKKKKTVLRYYSLVNCIHVKKLTVLLKHVNPSINVATTEIPTIILNYLTQKVISMWQDVWSNDKIRMHRPRKHTGNFLEKYYDECSIRVVDCSIRVFRFFGSF